jgi:hypothetical protein
LEDDITTPSFVGLPPDARAAQLKSDGMTVKNLQRVKKKHCMGRA